MVLLPRLIALGIRLPSFATVVALMFIAYVAILLVRALFSPLRHIPFGVGHWLYGQIDNLADAVHGAIARALADRVAPLSQFLTSLAHETVVAWDSVGDLASTIANDLEHWTTHGLHDTIKAFTNAVLKVANQAHAIAAGAAADVIDLRHDIDTRIRGLREYVETELFGRAMRGIDKLRNDVFDRAIPAIRGEIGEIAHGIDARIGSLTDRLAGVERWIGSIDLKKLLEILATFAGVAALVDVIAREAGLENAECRSKVKGICTTDPDLWKDLLGLLVVVEGSLTLRELAIIASDSMEEVAPFVREMVDA